MRIAQQPGSNKKELRRGFALFLVLLLMLPLTVLRAEEPTGPAEVSTADIEVTDQALIVDLAISNLTSVRSFNLTSPSRIVFDIEDAVLVLAEDATTLWENPLDGIVDLSITQFSMEPPVVRIVAEITNPAYQSDRLTSPDKVSLAIFTGDSPLVESGGPGAPPGHMSPTIEKFWHEATDAGEDRFVIEFSFGVVLPQVRIESPTVLLLRFPGTDVLLPPTSPDNFATSVGGILVERMRAERLIESGENYTEIRLTVPDTNAISYTLGTFAEDSLELMLFAEEVPEPVIEPVVEEPVIEPVVEEPVIEPVVEEPVIEPVVEEPVIEPVVEEPVIEPVVEEPVIEPVVEEPAVEEEPLVDEPEPTPVTIEGGEVMVLASGDDVPVMPDAPIHITRVQFQAIDTETDRYYIYYEGGELEPHIQRYNYPTRVALYFPEAAVVLPESAEGRFQAVVNGAVTDELKVFNRVIEDVGPESQFIFYFPGYEQENIGFSVDYVDSGLMHVDFYRTSVPMEIESPVEVNTSIDEPEVVPETEEVAETVIEAPEIEEPEPAVIEGPEILEETLPPELAGLENPVITVSMGEVADNVINFIIEPSEPMPEPQWIEYHYPDRLGLRFPYADVQLLEAEPGIGSSYTHVRAIPLVRAIMKNRDNEQHTTITFTLEGEIEEYTGDIRMDGGRYVVTFLYNPLPDVPEIIEEPPVPEVVEAPPVIEEPEVLEPEPVEIPEPVIEEPVVIEPVEIETPEPVVPVITVAMGEADGNRITFRITSTEPMPEPQWVEYHYPERLGLRFPYADVQLMDAEPGVGSSYTHVQSIPLVRAIMKNRDNEQHTTIIWTLAGSIEEYDGEIAREGDGYLVTFMYSPMPVPEPVEEPEIIEPEPLVIEEPEPPVVEEPEPVVIEEPVVQEEEIEITPEPVEEPVVVEEPEVEVPGVPAAPGAPPFEAPVSVRPLIEVSGGEVVGDRILFTINTSEVMPIPEWVEYRYPDRLGLRFPVSDVKILGEEDAYTVNTNLELIPIVRAIIKDRPNEQHTTVTFTLGGSLDEFDGEIDWKGQEILVAFNYNPTVPEVVEPEPEITIQPEAVEQIEVRALPEEPQEEVVEEEIIEEPEPLVFEIEEVVEVPAEAAEGEVGPVRIAQAPEAEEEEEELGVEVETEGPEIRILEDDRDETEEEFEGVLITGISFENSGSGDIIRLASNAGIDDWEVTPANYPTKLVVKIPDSRPVFVNGDLQRYDETVDGAVVTQYVASAIVSNDVSYTTLMIYAHDTEEAAMLEYDVRRERDGIAIAVFHKNGENPLEGVEEETHFEIAEDAVQESDETETLILEGVGEPVPVREVEGLEDIEPEDVDADEVGQAEPKITMMLEDANIRDVLQMIGAQAELDIFIHQSVQGNITISLTEVPLSDLLELLGDHLDFTYYIKSGIYTFGKADELQRLSGDLYQQWYLQLSYADPDQVRNILTSMGMLSQNQIQIYRGSTGGLGTNIANQIMVLHGEPRDLERAYSIIANIDQPPMMVQVHFQILNTSLTDNRNFGFIWNVGTGTGTTNLIFTEQTSLNPDMGPFPQGFDRLRSNSAYSINVVVNYLLEEGYAELVNSSTLTVANNQSGNLFVGETVPYRSTYQVSELGRVTQRVSTQSVGLTLSFRPHANPDGTVTMYMSPSNSNLLELTDIGPRTVNQNFTTTVRVQDGEPFIIGGFIRNEERVNYDRFPFLSELPLLGHLFRNRQVMNSKSELIFVVTPHIVYPSRHPLMVWMSDDNESPVISPGRPY